MQKLTITEIAQLAGVSIGTVSRALNGRAGISSKTREAVMRVVQRTGFVPNVSARRLAWGTRQLVGVAIFSEHASRSAYHAQLFDAIQERLYEKGFVARVLDVHDTVVIRKCSGFIVPGMHFDDSRVAFLQRHGVPLAVVGRSENHVSWVDLDNANAMRTVTEHLIRMGHTNIAHLTGSPIGQTTQARLDAYRAALATANLMWNPDLILEGGFTDLGAYRAVRKMLKGHNVLPFTAISAASDEMAQGAILALHDLGLNVPRDVSVTGFDDLPITQPFNPSLTTMRQPIREIGHLVSELLLEQIDGLEPRNVVLKAELIVRSSSGPAAVDDRVLVRSRDNKKTPSGTVF